MSACATLLLITACAAVAESRFEGLDRDLKSAARELRISDLRAAVIESGRVVWKSGNITALAPEEPVIAERIPPKLLDSPAPEPHGATIRQVLENRADGTPSEEVLENRGFFEALRVGGKLPGAIEFAKQQHGPLGWFVQEYRGERMLWSYAPSLTMIEIPAKQLTFIASADSNAISEAARLQDGNILRSNIALAFLGKNERDESINRALIALYFGDRTRAAMLAHPALDQFPELESAPDVTLLYLFAQLGLRETEASATAVIAKHPSLPTAWFYYGQYLENSKRFRESAACYEKIAAHDPPWHNWTVPAAQKELTYLRTY